MTRVLRAFIRQGDGVAVGEVCKCIDASAKIALRNVPVLNGFAWHMIYPWPQRLPGLINEGSKELASRWRPFPDYARDRGCRRFRCSATARSTSKRVFSLLTDRIRWLEVLECEGWVKSPEQGACEGSPFMRHHLIESTTRVRRFRQNRQ